MGEAYKEPQIWVSKIPESFASGERLEEYFTQFGDVIAVTIEEDGVACITFAPEVDVQIILSETHNLDGQDVEVIAADSGGGGGAGWAPKRRRLWHDNEAGGPEAQDEGVSPTRNEPHADGDGAFAREAWEPGAGSSEAWPDGQDPPPEGGLPGDAFDPEAGADLLPEERLHGEAAESEGRERDGEGKGPRSPRRAVQSYRRGERWHESSEATGREEAYKGRGDRYGKGGGSGKAGRGTTSVDRDKVFVGGWEACNATEEDIRKYFDFYGKVKHVSLKQHGFCSVHFDNEEAVRKVLTDYRTHKLNGRWFEVRAFGRFAATADPRTPTEKDRIFLGGLDKRNVSESKVREYFLRYDEVVAIDIRWDKGFGFVNFASGAGKQLALWDHANHRLDGKWFDVQPCVVPPEKGEKGDRKGDAGKGWGKFNSEKGSAGGKNSFTPFAPPPLARYDSGKGKGKDQGYDSGKGKGKDPGYDSGKGKGKDQGDGAAPSRGGFFSSRDSPGKGGGPSVIPARNSPAGRSSSAPSSGGWARADHHSSSMALPSPGDTAPSGAPSSWTVLSVQRWLKQKNLEEVCGIFAKQEVTGAVLLSLTEKDLETSLGIQKFGVRRQLMLAVQELTSQSGSGSYTRAPSQGGYGPGSLRPSSRAPGDSYSSRGPHSGRDNGYSAREAGYSDRDRGYTNRDRDHRGGKDGGGYSSMDGRYSGRDRDRDREYGARDSYTSSGYGKGGKDSYRSRPY